MYFINRSPFFVRHWRTNVYNNHYNTTFDLGLQYGNWLKMCQNFPGESVDCGENIHSGFVKSYNNYASKIFHKKTIEKRK